MIHSAFKIDYKTRAFNLTSDVLVTSNFDKSKSEKFIALWDTGAMATAITPKIAEKLELPIIDTMQIKGVNSDTVVPVSVIDLLLPSKTKIEGVRVAIANIEGADMLIGMNIITCGDMAIANKNGNTILTFAIPPLENSVDLFEAAKKQ